MKINTWLAAAILLVGSYEASYADTAIPPTCSRQSAPIGLPIDAPPAKKIIESDASTNVAKAALRLVYSIENGLPDPYLAVTGNFDGQGLSLGLIQFNFGGSAQKVFSQIPHEVYSRTMPKFGESLYKAVHASSTTSSIQLLTGMQTGNGRVWRVNKDAKSELEAFLGSPEVRSAQDQAVAVEYQAAYSRAYQWAAARGSKNPSPREIATFMDNQVFSGGALGSIWIEQAKAFRASFDNDGKMIAFVSQWLLSCPYTGPDLLWGREDAQHNAEAWTKVFPIGSKLSDERALLFAFGFLRALTANGPPTQKGQPEQHGIFKAQVVERRGLIALGAGTANGIKWPGGILDQD
ncbi:hypothetical protein ACQKP6_01400 [Pseudomonas fluorescens]|uniref:hypothetical protein n=1 Tax=Pseudomonas fluorescens TaxID=294 RepID=UPI003CFC4145